MALCDGWMNHRDVVLLSFKDAFMSLFHGSVSWSMCVSACVCVRLYASMFRVVHTNVSVILIGACIDVCVCVSVCVCV